MGVYCDLPVFKTLHSSRINQACNILLFHISDKKSKLDLFCEKVSLSNGLHGKILFTSDRLPASEMEPDIWLTGAAVPLRV